MIFSGETRGTLTKIENNIKILPITNIINIGLEIPVNIIGQWKEIGDIKIRNEVGKLSFFTASMIVYLESPQESTEKLLQTIKILLTSRVQK